MDTTDRVLDFHQAQYDFLQSNAIFRAFTGGIGSGKSFAGSYDIIRRAKRDRLYLVMAPTYSMLSDATFRSFKALATDLDLIADIKPSAPPFIKLRTGAEVIFRSADDPEKLRGPNLSGIWMDEASLMMQEAFTIAIGRLREGGEQGWLTATFTPKGRLHWTFETFATGKENTAIFRARTSDNPFLPAEFTPTVRGQYTSTLAAQELEGEFIDSGGMMFKRYWFGMVDEPPVFKSEVRAWDMAATPLDEEKARDPDWTAGVRMGRTEDGVNVITDVRRIRGTPQQVQELVRTTAEQDGRGVMIRLEQEPGSAGVAVVDHYRRHVLAGYRFVAERATGHKADRAQPLAAQAEGGACKLLRGLWNKDFLDEAEMFPFGSHDDMVDAASAALNALTTKRTIAFRAVRL